MVGFFLKRIPINQPADYNHKLYISLSGMFLSCLYLYQIFNHLFSGQKFPVPFRHVLFLQFWVQSFTYGDILRSI